MNKMFDAMKLSKHIFEQPKFKLLLTMCYGLDDIAKERFEIYDVLRKISAVDIDNTALQEIGLEKIIKESINDNLDDNHKINKSRNSIGTISFTDNTNSKFNGSNVKVVIRGLLDKIKNLTVKDFTIKDKSSVSVSFKHKDLDVWEPQISLEKDNNLTENRRIFKGKRTTIESYPFIVSLNVLGLFACAGNIISKDLVLTAASCLQIHYNNRFFRERPKTIFVRVGSAWTMRGGEVIPVLEVYFHPQYDPKTLKHNLAIARLEKILRFKHPRKVKRILLDRFEGNLPTNVDEVLILGWGPKEPFVLSNKFDKLSCSRLEIYPKEECKQVYLNNYVTENNFCAGFFSKGSGACNRDVGGPGVVGGLLVGIVSFGSPVCGMPNSPTVFTRVGNYIDWIERIMEQHPARHRMTLSTPIKLTDIFYYQTIPTTPHLKPVKREGMHFEDNEGIPNRVKTTTKELDNLKATTINERSKNNIYVAEDDYDSPLKLKTNPYLNSSIASDILVKKYDFNYKNFLPESKEHEPNEITKLYRENSNDKYLVQKKASYKDNVSTDEIETEELDIFEDYDI